MEQVMLRLFREEMAMALCKIADRSSSTSKFEANNGERGSIKRLEKKKKTKLNSWRSRKTFLTVNISFGGPFSSRDGNLSSLSYICLGLHVTCATTHTAYLKFWIYNMWRASQSRKPESKRWPTATEQGGAAVGSIATHARIFSGLSV